MAVNLADILKGVSDSDTGLEQIEYIPLTELDEDPDNFYQLSGIAELADNIALCGLQQPIRVRQKEGGRYVIVSGHRRRAALEALVADGYDQFAKAACIVERDEVSPALQQLRLIYANAATRKMTAAETAEEADRVTNLLYKLQEEGYVFPGRMRDHVSQAMSISKSKLARLKVIRENLDESWADAWKDGILTESQAYALAQMPGPWQSVIKDNWPRSVGSLHADTVTQIRKRFEDIQNIQCQHGLSVCEHAAAMMGKSVDYNGGCYRCCFDCASFQNCKSSCPEAAGKKKELRDIAKAANQKAKAEREERNHPGAEFARLVWDRIGNARIENRVSVKKLFEAQKRFYSASYDDPQQRKMETGNGDYSPITDLPFGYNVHAETVMKIRDVADALGCSIDYLFGRTDRMEVVSDSDDDPKREKVSYQGTEWNIGDPTEEGEYILLVRYSVDVPLCVEQWDWSNRHGWQDESSLLDEDLVEILGWIPMPKLPVKTKVAYNNNCFTGISPSGNCGAAAFCNREYTCCLQCPDECNGRCGWIDDAAEVMTE